MRMVMITLVAVFSAATAAHADQVWLTMDHVSPYEFKQDVDQIVVGNPGIADVTVRDKSKILLFGKAPGITNLFLFDADGKEIDNVIVRVRATNSDLLTFHRGAQRTSFNCMTTCEATITVGDSTEVFGNVSQQVQQKYQQATSGTAPTE